MASKRIDQLSTRVVVNTDLLPPTPSGGPSGSATVAAVVAAGLQQPNSASSGAGANLTIKAPDGVTSGAGGSIILQPGAQATTGGNGKITVRQPGGIAGTNETLIYHDGTDLYANNQTAGGGFVVGVERNGAYTGGIRCFRVHRADNPSRYIDIAPDNSVINFYAQALIEANQGQNYMALRATYIVITDNANAQDCAISRASVGTIRVRNNSTGGASFAYTAATTSISSNQNDYVLTGSAFQRLNCTSASDLTGIAPPTSGAHVDGRMIKVFNVGTANLTLKHNSASSSAANRMYSVSGSDIVLGTNDYAECVYDSTDNGSGAAGWRIA